MKRALCHLVPLFIIAVIVFVSLSDSTAGVVDAQTTRQLPAEIRAEQTPPDITITGGFLQVAGIGDFNGDGIDDFLVKYERSVGDAPIIVFFKFGIIFGKRNPAQPIMINLVTDEPDLALTTALKEPFWYSAIATLGDLNGDGIDDMVVTQVRPEQVGQPAESVLKVFFGSAQLQPGAIDIDARVPDLKIIPQTAGFSSVAIAGAADVNGDGVKDLLLTSSSVSSAFDIPILLGPFAPGATIDLRSQPPDIVIQTDNQTDRTILRTGDFNGDHIADVLLKKVKLIDPIGVFATELNILFGSADWQPGTRISLSEQPADAVIAAGYDPGLIIQVGDVTGDGISDILTGSPTYFGEPAPPAWFTGNVNIYFGSASLRGQISQVDMTITGLPMPFPFHFPAFPTTLGDHLGEAMAISDINNDGLPDLLIGAPGATTNNKGKVQFLSRAHIIIGSPEIKSGARIDTAREQQDVTISFDDKTSGVGRRVASKDFNGDGIQDILVASDGIGYVYFSGPLRAPALTSAKYKTGAAELSLFGKDLNGAARVEINGVVIDRAVTFDAEQGRLTVSGSRTELNLGDGKNQIVVLRKGARSNAIKIKVK